ncbi:MAG: hypothetical protein IJL12_04070 [Selenomonadaceae bacterium]|nr:hypothetical protein [Selenomonadaceae bacterium]
MYPVFQTLNKCNGCGTIYYGAHDCIGKIGEGSCPNPDCDNNYSSPAVSDDSKGTWI